MRTCRHVFVVVALAVAINSAASAATILDFTAAGVSLPEGQTYLNPAPKPFVSTNDPANAIIRYDFSTADGQPLFVAGDRPLCYGGAMVASTNVPIGLAANVRFNSSANAPTATPGLTIFAASRQSPAEKQGYPHTIAFLALWRKDQFLGEAATGTVRFDADSRFQLHTSALTTGDVRFVVRNGDTYYASEFALKTNNIGPAKYNLPPLAVTLTGFNKSGAPGSRWMKFAPAPANFNLPSPLPACEAVDFNDVREVGVLLVGGRPAYAATYNIDQFSVTATVAPK
jgi:hypothetical protein